MKGAIDEGKDISPMFPRLHVKDAEKGGPKAPPRNKMALYEQFSIPSQSFASGPGKGSESLFPLPLSNCTVSTTSRHVSQNACINTHVGGSQSIQFCTSNAPSILSEKIQAYDSRKINLIKSTQDNFINSKNSLKTLDGGDAFITPGSPHVKSSWCGIIQNDKDEDKSARCNLSCSLKSLNSFRKVVNSPGAIELKSAQYGKNQMEEDRNVSQIGQKEEEGNPHSLDGFDDTTDAISISLVKGRNYKSMKKEHRSLKEESRSISVDSLKTLQGSNGHTQKDHADKINSRDHCMEKPTVSDVHKFPGELEIGRRCFLGKRDGNKDEETCSDYDDALNKPSSECGFGLDISPDDVVGVIGEKQFWTTRTTIINQQRIFLMQVFELHRLIKVQRLIAGSPHILLEDNLVLNKPPLKTPSPKKSQPDFLTEQPSTVLKLDIKSEKVNNAVEKVPLPCVSNVSKGHINHQLSNYGHHLGNLSIASADKNSKQSPSIVFPPPPGNQWLVPVMSPSEGLVYKPIITPCPPNAGIMTPLYGTCSTMSFNSGSNKDVVLDAAIAPACPQKIGILSGSSLLPPLVPSSFMHRSISASAVEKIGQSNGPENHYSYGEANSAILYQSPSNMSCQVSQVMSRNVTTYHHSLEDKELQISTASSPSKRVKGDVLPLFPVAPTFWPSADHNSHDEQQQSKVIKALPHNPKSATESAARIFRSIQEERKLL